MVGWNLEEAVSRAREQLETRGRIGFRSNKADWLPKNVFEFDRVDAFERRKQRRAKAVAGISRLNPPNDGLEDRYMDLMFKVLVTDSTARPSVEEILEHPFWTLGRN